MSFDNTKYDIELNGVSHRVKGYLKSEAPSFIPRVGGGNQSENEFNTLLSRTLDGFSGGILQREWKDDQSVFATEGLFPIYGDGVLYPVNPLVSGGGGKYHVMATAQTKDYIFVAKITYTSPTTSISRIDTAGASTNLTLPSSLGTSGLVITSMVIWQNKLWIFTGAGFRSYYMDLTSTTVTEIGTYGTSTFQQAVIWKNQLYGTGASNHILYRYTGTTSTKSDVEVGRPGPQTDSPNAKLFIFNNRIMLSRTDGLYAYDGIQLVAVEDNQQYVNSNNYRHATVLRGNLYYFMPDGFYRYTGAMIERLYDISEIGMPEDVCAGKNRLWFIYNNGETTGSSRYDKSMGYDYISGNSIDGRVSVFDGRAMYTYGRTTSWVKNPGTEDFSGQGILKKVAWFNDKLYIWTFYSKVLDDVWTASTAETTNTGNKPWVMVTSVTDSNFPQVDKNLDNLQISFDGNVSSDQTITIEYRISGFEGSTGWTTLGTFSSQTELKRYIWKSIAAGIVYKKIQFRLSGTTAATYGISKLTMRYTLSPDFKWEWRFTVLNYGDESISPLLLADGTSDSQSVQTLRGNLYLARSNDTPVKFIDVDQLDLNGAINSAATTAVLNSTSLLKGDEGFIQIDDEIMYWTGKTATNLTVIRGVLGTTAASHSNNAKVFIVYRVFVNQIQGESVMLTDNATDNSEDKSRTSETTLLLREV